MPCACWHSHGRLWGTGTAFPDFGTFLESMKKRGVSFLEMLAMEVRGLAGGGGGTWTEAYWGKLGRGQLRKKWPLGICPNVGPCMADDTLCSGGGGQHVNEGW